MLGEFELDKIHCGDSAVMLARLPDECIDLTVTSPPYDNLRTYNGYSFDFEAIARQLYRVTKPGGVVVWVVADETTNGSESVTSCKQKIFFREQCGFYIHDTMIYEKANFSNPSKNRYHQVVEYMFVLSKGAPKTFNPIIDMKNKYGTCWGVNTFRHIDGSMKIRKKNKAREYGMRTNIWRMKTAGQENICKPQAHPAPFPESLAHDHILSWSNPGDVVLDPMCGSGTTSKEAKELGRHFICFDISAEYVEQSTDRAEGARVPLGLF